MIFQGSQQEGSESSFWDFCALRIIAPIKPIDQIASIKSSDPSAPSKSVDQIQSIEPEKEATELHVHVILRGSQPSFGLEATTSVMSINTAEDTDCVELLHPRRRLSPMHTIPVSTQPVCVDQVVRRLGYPGFPQMMDLSVDSGRVEQNDPAGDILISLLSDDGASGGPVIDREGKLIGLLSRSHTFIKFSCVQPLRNMFEILRQNEL